MPGKPGIDAEYLDAPYLTLGINLTTAFGLFFAVWTAFYVLSRDRFGAWWWLVLALAVDVTVNVVLRVMLHRKRALDPDLSRRLQGPEPPDAHHRYHDSDARWRGLRKDDD